MHTVYGGAHSARPKRSQRRETEAGAQSVKLNVLCPSSATRTLSIQMIRVATSRQSRMGGSGVFTCLRRQSLMAAPSDTRISGPILVCFDIELRMLIHHASGSPRLPRVGGVLVTTIGPVSSCGLAKEALKKNQQG